MRVIMPRFSHRLALKIVLPFAALTLAIGAVGTLTATGELNARSQEGFDSQLVHDGFVTQSMVVAGDNERRAILRLLANGPGLSQNWDKTATLTAWLERAQASGLQAWRTFVKTVHNWQESILNYFDGRHSNGFAEGVNLKIKLLNRRAFGYRNFNSFRLHILAAFGP